MEYIADSNTGIMGNGSTNSGASIGFAYLDDIKNACKSSTKSITAKYLDSKGKVTKTIRNAKTVEITLNIKNKKTGKTKPAKTVKFKINAVKNRAKIENSKISINIDDFVKNFKSSVFKYPGKKIDFTKKSSKSNSDVAKIQMRLKSLGYAKDLKVNGLINEETLEAVNKYKSVKKIGNYGIVDEATWNRLFAKQKIYDKNQEKGNLVAVAQLKKFGWSDTSDEFIKKLNDALVQYDITDRNSITLFMATMAEESGWGTKTIEQGSDAYFAHKAYGKNGRGAGYIQITWTTQHLEFLKTMGDNFSGQDTAKHISDNYPMEAAAWFWSNAPKTGDGNLNAYVKKNGHSLGIYLVTQYFVNGVITDENGNENKTFMDDLSSIRKGTPFKISNNSLIVNGNTWRLPTNWDSRKDAYNKAIKAFK